MSTAAAEPEGPYFSVPSSLDDYRRFRAQTPNIEQALEVEEVDAETLTERDFDAFRLASKPVVIRGAVRHWPGYRDWQDRAFLENLLDGDEEVGVQKGPAPINSQDACADPPPELQRRIDEYKKRWISGDNISWAQFLDSWHREDGDYFKLGYSPRQLTKALHRGMGDFSFISPKRRLSPFIYTSSFVFMYRSTYSDWHFHPVVDALMSQVRGDKEVLLHAPGRDSFEAHRRLAFRDVFMHELDKEDRQNFSDIPLYRVTVRAGDSLYIPLCWWHVVYCLDAKPGFTIARFFDAPFSQVFESSNHADAMNTAYLHHNRNFKQLTGPAVWALRKSSDFLRSLR